LPGLDLGVIAKTLECGLPRDVERRSLLERQVVRLQEESILAGPYVFREGRRRAAKDLVARVEARDVRADGLDRAREIHAPDRLILLPHDLRDDLKQ
jgi:hypothetical protein